MKSINFELSKTEIVSKLAKTDTWLSLGILVVCALMPVTALWLGARASAAIGVSSVMALAFGIPCLLVVLAGIQRARMR